ncbi:MAG: Zn-ribbon domain-containing OB-fold protein [Actinomycetota bacterium]
MAITRATFPLPDVDDPLTAPYFAGAARGELVVPRCAACARFVWYPEPTCPACGAEPVWTPVSGRGTLFSWAVVRRPFLPAFAGMVPFVTGLVALAEDPAVRIPTLVTGTDPDALAPDAPVHAVFRPLAFPTVDGSVVVPMFEVAP